MGSITAQERPYWFVAHESSVAIVYAVEENAESRQAVRGMIDAMRQDGSPVLVLIDQAAAHVYAVRRGEIPDG